MGSPHSTASHPEFPRPPERRKLHRYHRRKIPRSHRKAGSLLSPLAPLPGECPKFPDARRKYDSETANIPVYKQSAEYAIEHDELPTYRESFRVNMACRDALESAIHESYHDYCLDTGKAAAQVAVQFGMERVAYVLANTVRAFDHDGRISRDNKAWAQTVPVCTDADEWGHERSRYFLVSQVNPGLVNLLVSCVREELAKEKHAPAKRPSVLEKIQKNKTAIQTKTAEKKLPGQER